MRPALLVVLLLGAPALRAQGIPPEELPPGAGFAWEQVGDRGVNPAAFAIGPDGALWAGASAGFAHLADPNTPGAAWEVRAMFTPVNGSLLPLGRGPAGDTLLGSQPGAKRSLDGGRTWTVVGDAFAGFAHGPGSRLLVATGGVAYSDDRGAAWTEAPHPGGSGTYDLLTLPPAPGRAHALVLSGGWGGVAVSADSARSFAPSGLWGNYAIQRVAAVGMPGGPAGAQTVIAAGWTPGSPYARAWTSADDGATWGAPVLLRDVADGGVGYQSVQAVVPLGGPTALLILGRGAIYRTDDAGATWALVGRAPIEGETAQEVADTYVITAEVGPDGRLYVAQLRIGCCYRAWVWRTAEPVVVASEGGPAPERGLSLSVAPNPARGAASLGLTLGRPSEARVVVYDLLGRAVAVVHDGPLGAGPHRLALTEASAPGVYVVRATAGGEAVTARLVLTR